MGLQVAAIAKRYMQQMMAKMQAAGVQGGQQADKVSSTAQDGQVQTVKADASAQADKTKDTTALLRIQYYSTTPFQSS